MNGSGLPLKATLGGESQTGQTWPRPGVPSVTSFKHTLQTHTLSVGESL
jgi:hypothetical protein